MEWVNKDLFCDDGTDLSPANKHDPSDDVVKVVVAKKVTAGHLECT